MIYNASRLRYTQSWSLCSHTCLVIYLFSHDHLSISRVSFGNFQDDVIIGLVEAMGFKTKDCVWTGVRVVVGRQACHIKWQEYATQAIHIMSATWGVNPARADYGVYCIYRWTVQILGKQMQGPIHPQIKYMYKASNGGPESNLQEQWGTIYSIS